MSSGFLAVAIDKLGTVYVSGHAIEPDNHTTLNTLLKSSGHNRIVIQADGDVPTARLLTVLATSKQTEAAHVVGLSILSGSHVPLVEDLMKRMAEAGVTHIPVIVGGIIPEADASRLRAAGVAQVYTPKDFELNVIMQDIITLADRKAVAAE